MVSGTARVEEQVWRTYASARYLVETSKVEQPARPPAGPLKMPRRGSAAKS
ncbi:hypothetical protein ACPZ19_49725 [Amycolatopsis lurida]